MPDNSPTPSGADAPELVRLARARLSSAPAWNLADAMDKKSGGKDATANPGELYSTIESVPDTGGARLIWWTSVEDHRHGTFILPEDGGFRVELGAAPDRGFEARAVERQEQRRLGKLIVRDLERAGFETEVTPVDDAIARLTARRTAPTAEAALDAADALAHAVQSRLGMEAAVFNLGRARENVSEIMDDETPRFIRFDNAPRADYPDTVFLTELTNCPRCRSKWADTVAWTREFPGVRFGFVFLTKSRAVFKEKVFGELAPEIMKSGVVAPMLFLFRDGRLREYLGTRLEEPPPSSEAVRAALERSFG